MDMACRPDSGSRRPIGTGSSGTPASHAMQACPTKLSRMPGRIAYAITIAAEPWSPGRCRQVPVRSVDAYFFQGRSISNG